ncbi:MAG: glycerophosphodiester phosphodiesterase [Chloroflexi bacterium]|nr:glycerophosphodiester phosphodiesterase [Chloroflexota bacterium]MXX82941.1 glycerophosphodiester phosphodiesterase [Chloroflexota bacterium]MYA94117.1 glycerophosphodiester phosphodiesterase [Chloroflexota bacterium]MYC55575.1 glycerophosphodiester phosphodiesterase [Chloroflexota bacterium]MYD38105.1 glycerophosphodiester phosphodiesterase [Chloroflexota bacterium]
MRTILADNLLDALTANAPLVFGHRGASADAPENTLAAFELAAQHGAHGIELDVHLTRDQQLAVIHNATVDATTNGSGAVAEVSLAQLKELDAGSWFAPEFAGERIPTLDEVFAAVGRRLFVNVEIKSAVPGIEHALAACIAQRQMEARVLVSSFDAGILRRLRPLLDVPLGFLCPFVDSAWLDAKRNQQMYAALHPWHASIDSELMRRARESGFMVNAWTVNDSARACQLKKLGVNGIITDQPVAILAALASC